MTTCCPAPQFASLKRSFPTWRQVLAAPSENVEDAIREGGLAEIKTARIKAILTEVDAEAPDARAHGDDISLDHLHALPTDEVTAS